MKKAILKTLHYADIFDYPLTADEIKKFLVAPVDAVFEEALSQIGSGPWYFLPGREEIVELRERREKWSQPKLERAQRIAAILKFIPWIKLIAATGALAMENSDEDDDIDLMIITASKRLWLTRGLVVMFLRFSRQYRRPGKIKDRICPNLMLSEDALEFPDHDLFTAHEIVQMKPIYDRENTYQKFVQANGWIKDFLPNLEEKQKTENRKQKSAPRPPSSGSIFHLPSSIFLFLEKIAYKLQLKYMESKRTTEVASSSIIRFHPQDIRRKVLDEYQERIRGLKFNSRPARRQAGREMNLNFVLRGRFKKVKDSSKRRNYG